MSIGAPTPPVTARVLLNAPSASTRALREGLRSVSQEYTGNFRELMNAPGNEHFQAPAFDTILGGTPA